ncbi:hypothetical protein JF66_19465 [Cryobacterium sp. MLB-32]|nr:hypothetical protein JF66_19465 [Cryobacterium sp. MLB-32]
MIILLGFAVTGFPRGYELLSGLQSPAGVNETPLVSAAAWTLSIIGWIAVPALIGAIVGYSVGAQIGRHRSRSRSDLFHQIY